MIFGTCIIILYNVYRGVGHALQCIYTVCRLMRRRIKVADPRICLVSVAYIHIREEVVDEYQTIT